MKILFLASGVLDWDKYPDPNYGREVQIWGIARELAKMGEEVLILKRGNDDKDKIVDNVRILNIKITSKDELFFQIPSRLLFSKKAVERIKIEKPDVMSLHFHLSSYYVSKMDIPKTYTIHTPTILDSFKSQAISYNILNWPFLTYDNWIERAVISRSNYIVVLNNYMKKFLKSRNYVNIKIIPNGIAPNDFHNRGDYGYILYAGRFDWAKRVDILVKAYSMLEEKYKKEFKLKLVGQGSNEKYLKELVKNTDLKKYVEFIPWLQRSKLIYLMSKCSIFVLPSFFECMPVVVLEAMASGKPVIASDVPGPQDIVIHGYNGFLFKRGDIETLAKYLELLCEDETLRRRVGKNARKTIEKKYTFEKISEEYIKLFNEILGE